MKELTTQQIKALIRSRRDEYRKEANLNKDATDFYSRMIDRAYTLLLLLEEIENLEENQ